MAAPVSGLVTLTSGVSIVAVGINANDVDTLMGCRASTVETSGMLSHGHADAGNQSCRTTIDGRADRSATNCFYHYNGSGVKVLEGKITAGWGTSMLTINMTTATTNFPADLVVRT